ncbi:MULTISPECIES: methylated-DNA--[protein]-cysteine S-methyltransferase [unclassified Streptomyces]|uniref:methylated-DNA--[protein]-cysteine S-methyltransferase n=1 Tax=unclassified Streptomyces TaxID=2593676 RepID=UPI000361AC15|nr:MULTISPECIES: methylated-DNA--[protein]-cysteine S-methyltransferase [unclassified Streptomyces]MYT28631.1 methylated-DNA--[protein]-cysteine S-methyltransferase [Streptomyces sp. SID8354]
MNTPDRPAATSTPASPGTTFYTTHDSPLGELLLVGVDSPTAPGGIALISLSLPGQRGAATIGAQWHRDAHPFAEAVRQLRGYFAGELTRFALEFRTTGTEFQERVWRALDKIPYGTTTTYGRLAEEVGVARGEVRAVGAAVGANPLLLVRPCHRVIGADGAMRGYAAGVERKVALLTHEGALQPTLI